MDVPRDGQPGRIGQLIDTETARNILGYAGRAGLHYAVITGAIRPAGRLNNGNIYRLRDVLKLATQRIPLHERTNDDA